MKLRFDFSRPVSRIKDLRPEIRRRERGAIFDLAYSRLPPGPPFAPQAATVNMRPGVYTFDGRAVQRVNAEKRQAHN